MKWGGVQPQPPAIPTLRPEQLTGGGEEVDGLCSGSMID